MIDYLLVVVINGLEGMREVEVERIAMAEGKERGVVMRLLVL